MSLKITWKEGPYKGTYPVQIKGPAVGAVDGRLLVAGGMSNPGGAVECGFWLGIDDTVETMPSMVVPGKNIEDARGVWQALPLLIPWASQTLPTFPFPHVDSELIFMHKAQSYVF